MLANYLIGLREGLEATLVVVILVAYLVRTGRREMLRHIWTGVGIAVAVSLGLGALLTYGPRGLEESTQEAIAGVLSLLTVGLVTWMVLWMARAARTLSGGLRAAVDDAIAAHPARLVLVALLAVGREGLETALFLWAATSSAVGGGESAATPLLGAALGIATAVLLGWLIHRGALRLDMGRFFTWTGAALVVVAAGVLAYGVHDLQEAGWLPGEDMLAFDLRGVVDPKGVLATVVRGVFNLRPAMSVLEVLAWVGYVVPVLVLFFRRLRRSDTPTAAPTSAADAKAPTTVA